VIPTRTTAATVVALVALLGMTGCSADSTGNQKAALGAVKGSVPGGCFGFGGPPATNAVTVEARALTGGQANVTVDLDVRRSNTTGQPFIMIGGDYSLSLPPGTYALGASGPGYTIDGAPTALGQVSVQANKTTSAPKALGPVCA
jgi:hypothetical protein